MKLEEDSPEGAFFELTDFELGLIWLLEMLLGLLVLGVFISLALN